MKRFWPTIRLPLLHKELAEQAARKRTYILRVLVAAALIALFLFAWAPRMVFAAGDKSIGKAWGREALNDLSRVMFFAIYLLLPAVMAGALTTEKERGSLQLLFLTGLKPWEILLQKYFGRLIAMFSLLLLGLPLFGIAYSLGGVSPEQVPWAVVALLLTGLQVGAVALMFSAYCRTTVAAFICSYLLGTLFYFTPLLLAFALSGSTNPHLRDVAEYFTGCLVPVILIYEQERGVPSLVLVLMAMPSLISALFFLLLARVWLIPRASVQPARRWVRGFQWLDRAFERANDKLMDGITVFGKVSELPERDPIVWRELRARGMGKLNHLVRLALLTTIPILLLNIWSSLDTGGGYYSESQMPMILALVVTGVASLVVTLLAANAIPSERMHQTLDVLLTTSLTGRDIVRQKMRGVSCLILVLALPLLLAFGAVEFECSTRRLYGSSPDPHFFWLLRLSLAVGPTVLALYAFGWISFWIGLRSHSRLRAILTALAVIALYNLLPFLAAGLLYGLHAARQSPDPRWFLAFGTVQVLGTPGLGLLLRSDADFREFGPNLLVVAVTQLAWYGTLITIYRSLCLKRADRYLRERAKRPFGWIAGLFGRSRRPTPLPLSPPTG